MHVIDAKEIEKETQGGIDRRQDKDETSGRELDFAKTLKEKKYHDREAHLVKPEIMARSAGIGHGKKEIRITPRMIMRQKAAQSPYRPTSDKTETERVHERRKRDALFKGEKKSSGKAAQKAAKRREPDI
jgi:hypothetical protein